MAVGTTAPTGQCPANGTCGNTGTCNGGGACTQASTSVTCAAAVLHRDHVHAARVLLRRRHLLAPRRPPAARPTSAAAPAATPPARRRRLRRLGGKNSYCTGTGGGCLPVKATGVACLSNHECSSGNCVDGVCCGSASCPTCQACNVTGSPGACANVANTVTEPHARCRRQRHLRQHRRLQRQRGLHAGGQHRELRRGILQRQHLHPGRVLLGERNLLTPTTVSCRPTSAAARACSTTAANDARAASTPLLHRDQRQLPAAQVERRRLPDGASSAAAATASTASAAAAPAARPARPATSPAAPAPAPTSGQQRRPSRTAAARPTGPAATPAPATAAAPARRRGPA